MILNNLYIDEQINAVKNTPKIKIMLQTSTEMSKQAGFLKIDYNLISQSIIMILST